MKPNISLEQLGDLKVTQGQFNDLLELHEEFVATFLGPRRPLLAEAGGMSPKVLGVGITENIVKAKGTGEAALLVLLDRIAPTGPLASRTNNNMPIIYEEVGEIRPATQYQDKHRPVQAGVSIAPCLRNYSGTLGCVVASNGVKYILSNNHVLADVNTLPLGSTISQQSIPDGGACPADVIAALSQFVPINLGGISLVDAAIARIANGVNVDPRILRDNGVVEKIIPPVTAPVIGLEVQKSGRTTGYTKGKVQAVGVTVTYTVGGGTTQIDNTFTVKHVSGNFGLAGDSGALITTQPANNPMGLLFAVDANNKLTYANKMSDVLTALGALTGYPVTVVT